MPRRYAPRNDIAEKLEPPTEPVKFRTAELSFVNCWASMDRRPFDRELYGLRELDYERKELAYLLADQLLASGGIAFREEGSVLRAELRAVMPE